jgi:hypothetical protein
VFFKLSKHAGDSGFSQLFKDKKIKERRKKGREGGRMSILNSRYFRDGNICFPLIFSFIM